MKQSKGIWPVSLRSSGRASCFSRTSTRAQRISTSSATQGKDTTQNNKDNALQNAPLVIVGHSDWCILTMAASRKVGAWHEHTSVINTCSAFLPRRHVGNTTGFGMASSLFRRIQPSHAQMLQTLAFRGPFRWSQIIKEGPDMVTNDFWQKYLRWAVMDARSVNEVKPTLNYSQWLRQFPAATL